MTIAAPHRELLLAEQLERLLGASTCNGWNSAAATC
jgi:hypothetical protein